MTQSGASRIYRVVSETATEPVQPMSEWKPTGFVRPRVAHPMAPIKIEEIER